MLPALFLIPAMLGSPEADLVAAAAATGRPRVCFSTAGDRPRGTVWTMARTPKLSRYCHLIARAHARLRGDPLGARSAALAAEEVLPGQAPTRVVMARTALHMDRVEEALREFQKALSIDPLSVEQPLAMHDLALAQRRSGKLREALLTYRVLVPRSGLLPGRERRAQVLLEAAHMAMAVAALPPIATTAPAEPAAVPKAPALDETLAFLREAASDPHHTLRLDVELSLVLALDRGGRSKQADAILNELPNSTRWAKNARLAYLAEPAEFYALRALAYERTKPALAIERWQRYLAMSDSKGPWAKAARARLERLQAGKQPGSRRRSR